MLPFLIAADGFWTDTVGLVFTYVILLPAIATGVIIVAIVAARGEKRDDEELRGRWGKSSRDSGV